MNQLKTDLKRFQEDFELIGTHLGHTIGSYEKAGKRFDKIELKIETL